MQVHARKCEMCTRQFKIWLYVPDECKHLPEFTCVYMMIAEHAI